MKNLVFTEQPNGKFTFSVEGDANATAYLLKNTIAHSIQESGIKFARPALEKLLEKYDANIDYTVVEESAMTKFNNFCTSKFRNGGLSSKILTHSANCIEAVLTLPDGSVFSGTGSNQRLARHESAKKACEFYGI